MALLCCMCVYKRNDVLRHELVLACESNSVHFIAEYTSSISHDHRRNLLHDVINSEIPTNSLNNRRCYAQLANGRTVLMSNTTSLLNIASQFSGAQTVDFLLTNGADIRYCDENKENALHKACKSKLDVSRKIRLLLQSNAGLMRQKTRLSRLLPVHMSAPSRHRRRPSRGTQRAGPHAGRCG